MVRKKTYSYHSLFFTMSITSIIYHCDVSMSTQNILSHRHLHPPNKGHDYLILGVHGQILYDTAPQVRIKLYLIRPQLLELSNKALYFSDMLPIR